MLEKNPNLVDAKSDENTIYFLEKLARKYVHENRDQIRTKIRIKEDLLVVLNFLVAKESVVGYMLRENIL